MDIKKGTVKYSAGTKTFQSKYSDKPQQSILLSMEDGTEERIYFDKGREPHCLLQRGEEIQIVYSVNKQGKRIRQLVANPSRTGGGMSAITNFAQPEPDMSAEDFINQKIEIFLLVFARVKDLLGDDFSTEDMRTVTTSILIDGDRKRIKFEELLDEPSKNL